MAWASHKSTSRASRFVGTVLTAMCEDVIRRPIGQFNAD